MYPYGVPLQCTPMVCPYSVHYTPSSHIPRTSCCLYINIKSPPPPFETLYLYSSYDILWGLAGSRSCRAAEPTVGDPWYRRHYQGQSQPWGALTRVAAGFTAEWHPYWLAVMIRGNQSGYCGQDPTPNEAVTARTNLTVVPPTPTKSATILQPLGPDLMPIVESCLA